MQGGFTSFVTSGLSPPPTWWSTPGLCLVLGLLFAGATPVQAQAPDSTRSVATYTIALRDVPLKTALQRFVGRTNADLAYSTDLVKGRSVYCRSQQVPVETLLSCILSGTGVDYLRTASGSYLLVESRRTAPPVGRVAGRVVDAATGEPLPNANVLLADAGTGTATNQAGRFTVAPVLAGKHRLVVTYVGYRTAVDSVRVPPDGRDTIRVSLSRRVLDTEPIVVDGLQRRLPSARLGKSTVNASGLRRLSSAGTPDVIRAAGQRVGVSLNRPLAELNIQGGDGGEQVTLLDGTPVREPVSLGGLLGAFSPQALERMTVHKTGFGVAQGSYTAGVLEATHDLSRSGTAYAAATLDPVSANGRAEASWNESGTRTGRAMVAARRSLWDIYRTPSLRRLLNARTALDPILTATWPGGTNGLQSSSSQVQAPHAQFSDLHAAVRQELTPFQELYVSGHHGSTRLSTDVATTLSTPEGQDRRLLSRERYDWTNTALQGRYEWVVGSRVTGSAQLWGSRHDAESLYGFRDSTVQEGGTLTPPSFGLRAGPHSGEGNEIEEWGLRIEADASLTPNVRLRAALEPRHHRGAFRTRNQFLGAIAHETSAWQMGSYLEAETSLGLRWTATAGTRLTYVAPRRTVYAEPRLSLRYDRASTPLGGVAVRLAGGLYRQYMMQSEISGTGPTSVVPSVQFWLPIDRSLAPPRALHTAGSVLLTPSDPWTARLELYHKWQPRTLHIDYAGLVHSPIGSTSGDVRRFGDQSAFMAAGRGRAYGGAVHVQRQGERVLASASAEWSRVTRRYPGRFGGRSVPAPWSQPVRLTTDLDVSLAEGLEAHAHWQGTWERPWALRRAYYDYLALAGGTRDLSYDLTRPGNQVLSPFSRLDLGLSAETRLRTFTLEARLNLVNVLDRHNAFDWSLDPTGPRSTPVRRTLPGRRLFVSLGLKY